MIAKSQNPDKETGLPAGNSERAADVSTCLVCTRMATCQPHGAAHVGGKSLGQAGGAAWGYSAIKLQAQNLNPHLIPKPCS